MLTLACSHIFSFMPKKGPEMLEAILVSIVLFQKRSGGNALPLESFQCSVLASPSSTRHLMTSHKSWEASFQPMCLQQMCLHCLSRADALICTESLLIDPCLMPSFRPVTATINVICIICYVNITVFDWMTFFCVQAFAGGLSPPWTMISGMEKICYDICK